MTHRIDLARSTGRSKARSMARSMARSTGAIPRSGFTAIVSLAATCGLMAVAVPSAAGAHHLRRMRPAMASAPRAEGQPVMAIVSLKNQQVTIYDADGWIRHAPVSSGIKGRETPAGVFSVVQKDKDHHSNLYDDAWMPNMLRLTWSGIALHGGAASGHPASHGCVRMPYGFADGLFDKMAIGTRVLIAPNDVRPVAFSDPSLFKPSALALAAASAEAARLEHAADEAGIVADQAKDAAENAAHDAAPLNASLHQLDRLKSRADGELALASKTLAAAKTDRAKSRESERKQKLAAKVATLQTQIDTLRNNGKSKLDAAASTQAAAKEAEARQADAAKAEHQAKLALVPVSAFVSRATQRLYVRRGFEATMEVPIKIRNPGKPIGTHVFTAVASAGNGLRWTAVTMNGADSAKSALERITIPQDVLARIGPTALPSSSIIISDEPLNQETNYRTEFVVVLNDQPQGGLEMRHHPDDVVARTTVEDDDAEIDRGRDSSYNYARPRAQYHSQEQRQTDRWNNWNTYGYARPRSQYYSSNQESQGERYYNQQQQGGYYTQQQQGGYYSQQQQGRYYQQQQQGNGWSGWGSQSAYARQRGSQYYNQQSRQGWW